MRRIHFRVNVAIHDQNVRPPVIVKVCKHGAPAQILSIEAETCGQRWMQEVRSGSSYLSNNDMRLHFGLGNCSHIEGVAVRWPSGLNETFRYPAAQSSADRFLTVVEGSGAPK